MPFFNKICIIQQNKKKIYFHLKNKYQSIYVKLHKSKMIKTILCIYIVPKSKLKKNL